MEYSQFLDELIEKNKTNFIKQNDKEATYANKIEKSETNWSNLKQNQNIT